MDFVNREDLWLHFKVQVLDLKNALLASRASTSKDTDKPDLNVSIQCLPVTPKLRAIYPGSSS